MPSAATLERFIDRVEQNAHVEAIQENNEPPRVGRDALVAHEARALSMAASVESQCVRPVFVEGDHVVIRWIFQFAGKDGSRRRIEELAYQRWEGERIVQEQFFYDPKQFIPVRP